MDLVVLPINVAPTKTQQLAASKAKAKLHVDIETERLFLREMTEEDFRALYKVLADSEIMKYYPYVFDENRVRNWIFRNIERYRGNDR